MTPQDALAKLKERVQYLIEHARVKNPLGVMGYTPAAFGEAYKALYLRDFTYMAESAPEFVPTEHVRAILELFVSRMSKEGLVPERITNEGEVIYVCHGIKPAADCAMFLVKLAAAYVRNGGDKKLIAAIQPKLSLALGTVPIDRKTGLVYIDPASPHTAYGFTDTIAITGHHLYCSLLMYEALEILGERARARDIKASIEQLWSKEDALYLAGSKDCRQPDIWGSAYTCVIGALSEERRAQVARSLFEKREKFLLRGQVRHLMTPAYWERLIVAADWSGPGKFQNGAYWGTASGWIAEAFEVHKRGAGAKLLTELAADFEANGVWECVGPDGYKRTANNVSSACLPYASMKRLLAEEGG